VVVRGETEAPAVAAHRIVRKLIGKRYLKE
jgi:hypothetical protein